jgi:hypothetical protein
MFYADMRHETVIAFEPPGSPPTYAILRRAGHHTTAHANQEEFRYPENQTAIRKYQRCSNSIDLWFGFGATCAALTTPRYTMRYA